MAELATIARPYANAVFKLARGEGALDRWSRMLGILAATAEHPVVERMLGSPDLPGTAKAFKLAEVCGDELDDRGKKFLQALAANDRLPLLEEISEQFEALKAEEQSSLDVEVVSAYPLSDSESEKLKTALSGRFAKEIAIASRVDPELIGGVVIRAGDMVIDGSLRGRLNKLAETLGQH